jgi:hypothetical protein
MVLSIRLQGPLEGIMRLQSLEYSEFPENEHEWKIEGLVLGNINLIVGKNASGKTRTLNVIHSLHKLLSGKQRVVLVSGNFIAVFDHDGVKHTYQLEHENHRVIQEHYLIGGEEKLKRARGGYGQIFAKEIDDGRMIKFQTPDTELAVVSRRDKVQHPFLDSLHEWGVSGRYFEFGKTMGHPNLIVLVKGPKQELDEHETSQVAAIFREGQSAFQDKFTTAVNADMGAIGYDLETIVLRRPHIILDEPFIAGELLGISVKEKDLKCYTDQPVMSQGMFYHRPVELLSSARTGWVHFGGRHWGGP